jgi:hypothetical protein
MLRKPLNFSYLKFEVKFKAYNFVVVYLKNILVIIYVFKKYWKFYENIRNAEFLY